ncbi:MAG: ribosome assembly factor SBDS [Methanomicrobia archaeon]|nr:ribosome assembly factor SBDS [Methanomicrobia archaeon]MCK4636309.1 ribosome assembly factor SBDS [Methanomicrobia archaeon]
MVTIDEATVARLKTQGERFEILIDPDKALAFKQGKESDDFLVTNYIFKDARKGEKASEEVLKKIFHTTDVLEISKMILKKGEFLYTAEQRKKMLEEKKKAIITLLSQGADPRTGYPHPARRIEDALEKAKVHIDPSKSPQEQMQDILKKIRPVLPIKFELREIAVKIPAQYSPKTYGVLKKKYKILKKEWKTSGMLYLLVSLPAGLQGAFYEDVNSLTKGEAETKLMERKG